jgi:hypothetical protein
MPSPPPAGIKAEWFPSARLQTPLLALIMRRAFWPYSATRRAVNLSCQTGTCGYDPKVYKTVAIADPNLAPGLTPPLSSNSLVHEYPNITAALNAVIAQNDPVGFVAMSAICSHGMYPLCSR